MTRYFSVGEWFLIGISLPLIAIIIPQTAISKEAGFVALSAIPFFVMFLVPAFIKYHNKKLDFKINYIKHSRGYLS